MKRKLVAFLAVMTAMTSVTGFAGCDILQGIWGNGSSDYNAEGAVAYVEATTETCVAIRVEKAVEGETLLDVMNALQEAGALAFDMKKGMVVAINGAENDADYNPCWMLYTTDVEMANTAWGTYEYAGQTLGSAIFGAETLPIKTGEAYVWVYQGF